MGRFERWYWQQVATWSLVFGLKAPAVRCYERILAADPDDTQALASMGFRLAEDGRFRDALARFANQFPALLEKFGHKDEPAPGLTRAMMRDMVFGGSEHIGFTAMIQKRADRIDVDATAKILAGVYLRGFGLE